MEEKETARKGELVVAMGLTGSRKSKYILRWALDKFLPEGNLKLKLFHVYPKVISVPTPMGSWIPIAQVREDVATKYRQEVEWKKRKSLLIYQQILKEKQVNAEIVMLESDDIAMGLTLAVARLAIRHLVIGVSSTSIFSRKMTLKKMMGEHSLSTVIAENAPDFCSVYIIADGKLHHMRQAESEPTVIDDANGLSNASTDSSSSSSSLTIGRLLKSRQPSPRHVTPAASDSASTSKQKEAESLPQITGRSKTLVRESTERRYYSIPETKGDENAVSTSFGSAGVASQSSGSSESWVSDGTSPHALPPNSVVGTTPTGSFGGTPRRGSTGSLVGTPRRGGIAFTPDVSLAGAPPKASSNSGSLTETPRGQNSELEQLKIELRHMQQMYQLTQNAEINERVSSYQTPRIQESPYLDGDWMPVANSSLQASKFLFPLNQLGDSSKQRVDKALKLKELPSSERNEHNVAQTKAEDSEQHAKRNSPKNGSEKKATHEAEGSATNLAGPLFQYQKFTWKEIVEATSSFSDEFKIGSGAFGTVYKCKVQHTTVAVKVLHAKDNATTTNKQFLQELEILSRIRHRHLLLLLGAVPEESCLVYEYMENGSLDDRLFRKNNTSPLPWYDRFRICWEVASALVFLHTTKPSPIIHRDLKPANILLDQNLVSKIGDAGLGTMINMEPTNKSLKTLYKETSPVGTLCYIDPEYQRTGRVSTKSDIYALGVVILQLLTAKPAIGIAYLIEDAIDEGNLEELLDPEAGQWPEKETLELAMLGLQCAELRGRDRPDLSEKVLPTLERLKEMADSARDLASNTPTAPPAHFICPILKDIMEDPYVAADGYTYDRRAIEQWLTEHSTSPTTDLRLPHKFIMPNNTLYEAIKQWKSNKQTKR